MLRITTMLWICGISGFGVIGIYTSPTEAAEAASQKEFQSIGLGGGGGMFSPAGSPHDPKQIYVSCDMGGFYVSEDAGKHWRMTPMEQMCGSTTCRPAFHPREKSTVYMPFPPSQQIRVSKDKGKTWMILSEAVPWEKTSVYAINLDPDEPRRMFVGVADGLYRSIDGGRRFAKCNGVRGTVFWTHLDRTSPVANRVCIAGSSDGIFVSKDAGKTWNKQGQGLAQKINGFCGGSNAKQVVCYASAGPAIYMSTDRGMTFKKIFEEGRNNFTFVSMTVSIPNVCYVTQTRDQWGIYKTENGGNTWSNVYRFFRNQPSPNVRYGWLSCDLGAEWGGWARGFAVSQAKPDIAMVTDLGMIFVTTNGGKTWHQSMSTATSKTPNAGEAWASCGLEVTTAWDYVFDPHKPENTYICYTDIGFARSVDRGKTWSWAARGARWNNTTYDIAFDPDKPGVIYAAASYVHDIPNWRYTEKVSGPGGVQISTDYAKTWSVLNNGLPLVPCTSICLDPQSPSKSRTLYCTMYGDGVYKSVDSGRTWQKKSNGLGRPGNMHTSVVRFGPNGALYCLITGVRTGNNFSVAGGLWKSTDGAETWTELTKDVDLWWPTEFTMDPAKSNHIYITTCDVPRKGGGGLFVSPDGGKTWKQHLSNKDFDLQVIDFVHNFGIRFHPKKKGVMYLCSWTHGLYISMNSGKTWKPVKGIPFQPTNRVTIDPKDPNTIYVTTFGGGVWRGPWNGY